MNIRLVILALSLVHAAVCQRAAGDEITLHPEVNPLAFRSPGRVVLLRDGRFACVSKGQCLTSADDGKSWTSLATIAGGSGPEVDGGMLVEDREGRLVLAYRDDAGLKLERTPDNKPLPGARLQVWCVRSADGGRTWGEHHRLIDGYCGAMIGAVCTREGRIVIPLQELRYNPPRHVTVVFGTGDGGKTWSRSEDLDIGGNGIEDGVFEPTVAQREDGSLIMFMRTTRNCIWRSESDDDGQTWALPKPTDIRASNSPSYLLSATSGRLALVWNPPHPTGREDWPRRVTPAYAERPDSVYREEMYLAFSEDGGETWTNPQILAKQPGGQLRYAYMLERRPGEIWLALRGRWFHFAESDFVTDE